MVSSSRGNSRRDAKAVHRSQRFSVLTGREFVGIITIARQAEAGGETVAERVATDLGVALVHRPLLERLTAEHGLSGQELDESDETHGGTPGNPDNHVHVDYLQAVLLDLAGTGDLVLVGRGGQFLFQECPWSLHVKVVASAGARRAALQRAQPLSDTDADAWLAEADRQRGDWIRRHYGADWEDGRYYDLIVRTDRLGLEGAAATIRQAAESCGILGHVGEIAAWLERHGPERAPDRPAGAHGFVHPSEAEFARVLDFYLPDLNLYLELTTLKQSLVTDKNRKVRRFRELYPDLQLKIFYGRDFRSLVQKYGLSPVPSAAGATRNHAGRTEPT